MLPPESSVLGTAAELVGCEVDSRVVGGEVSAGSSVDRKTLGFGVCSRAGRSESQLVDRVAVREPSLLEVEDASLDPIVEKWLRGSKGS